MTKAIARDPTYRWRQFSTETVSHTTILRWVLRYMPVYERRWDRHAGDAGSQQDRFIKLLQPPEWIVRRTRYV
jgi:hypothetical protein